MPTRLPGRTTRAHSTIPQTLEIAAADGVPLAATMFVPADRPPAACALVACAMGVRRTRYDGFARFLASNRIAALTFDYRGIGDSARVPARACTATLTEWAEQDIESLVEWLARRYPDLPLLGIGHSIGGQLFGIVPSVHRFAALFLVGAQRGYAAYWRGFSRPLIAGFWRVLPAIVGVFGYLPMSVADCEAIPPRVAREWRSWGLHPDFRDASGRSLSDRWGRFRGRLLSVSFEDDFFAVQAAVAALVRTYASARADHLHFSPSDFGRDTVGHSGFFVEGVCPGLWDRVVRWLLESAITDVTCPDTFEGAGATAFRIRRRA